MEITGNMVKACFNEAQSLFNQCKENINEVAKSITKDTGMNVGSAKDYLHDFFLMLTGERLKRAMAEDDARYYFMRMHTDYGENALRNALSSMQQYLDYDKQNHPELQNLVNEFKVYLD